MREETTRSGVKGQQRALGCRTEERLSGEDCEEGLDCCGWEREWVSGAFLQGEESP